jgi:hypothetical protein
MHRQGILLPYAVLYMQKRVTFKGLTEHIRLKFTQTHNKRRLRVFTFYPCFILKMRWLISQFDNIWQGLQLLF